MKKTKKKIYGKRDQNSLLAIRDKSHRLLKKGLILRAAECAQCGDAPKPIWHYAMYGCLPRKPKKGLDKLPTQNVFCGQDQF